MAHDHTREIRRWERRRDAFNTAAQLLSEALHSLPPDTGNLAPEIGRLYGETLALAGIADDNANLRRDEAIDDAAGGAP